MAYADLQSDLVELLSDNEVDTTKARDFIAQAEPLIDRDLLDSSKGGRVPRQKMTRLVTQTLSDGTFDLPSDYHKARSVSVSSYKCRYASPEMIPTQESGEPQEGFADATLVLDYYQQIPVLSDTNTTNWLLDLAPNVYLYASAMRYSVWRQNTENLLGLYRSEYLDAVKTLKDTHSAQPRGGLRRQNGRNYNAFYTVIGEKMYFGSAR